MKTSKAEVATILSWAWRDQDECRQCGDSEKGENECKRNMRLISWLENKIATGELAIMCPYCLASWGEHEEDCER